MQGGQEGSELKEDVNTAWPGSYILLSIGAEGILHQEQSKKAGGQ